MLGYASLFDFLHRELRVSRGAAFYRSTAARLVREYPAVAEALGDGRLCITSVAELAKVITPENAGQVLPRFFHASKREAQAIAAELRPVESPPRRDVVTAVSLAPRPAEAALAARAAPTEPGVVPAASAPAPLPLAPPARVEIVQPVELETLEEIARRAGPPADEITALTGDLRRLHVTVSRQCVEKLEAAREALSHSLPRATTGDVLEAALDLVLAARDRRKGLVRCPGEARRDHPVTSDGIPAAVRGAVWERDRGCCQWRLHSGGICGSKHQVELDHIQPRALGGASTVDNLRLLCKAHNLLAARLAYGAAWMERFAGTREPVAEYGGAVARWRGVRARPSVRDLACRRDEEGHRRRSTG